MRTSMKIIIKEALYVKCYWRIPSMCKGEPRARFTQLATARRYQRYLERKGYEDVCIYILVKEV